VLLLQRYNYDPTRFDCSGCRITVREN